MDRREFLECGLRSAVAGGALLAGLGPTASPQEPVKPSHPLFFDGLSYPSPDPADVRRSGLSGFVCSYSPTMCPPPSLSGWV